MSGSTKNSRTLLVLGAGPMQLPCIQRAREFGYRVVAVDGDVKAAGLAAADVGVCADITNSAEMTRIAAKYGINGVVTFSVEVSVRSVAAVAEALGLCALSREAARNSTRKDLMRQIWREEGLPIPDFWVCESIKEALAAAGEIGLPVVVKPCDGAGSRGVRLVSTGHELESAFREAFRASMLGRVMVEQFVDGIEVSVEGFVRSGQFYVVAMSDKRRTTPPPLLDLWVLFPSEMDDRIRARLIDVVGRAAISLGIDNSPVHAEVMVTREKEIRIVELAARGPGFKVFSHMIPWVSGIDVVELQILMALGEQWPDFSPMRRGAVLHFPVVAPGIVRKISGIRKAQEVEGIIDAEVYVRVGDRVRPLFSGRDRVAHIIGVGQTRSEAEVAVLQAAEKLAIETSP